MLQLQSKKAMYVLALWNYKNRQLLPAHVNQSKKRWCDINPLLKETCEWHKNKKSLLRYIVDSHFMLKRMFVSVLRPIPEELCRDFVRLYEEMFNEEYEQSTDNVVADEEIDGDDDDDDEMRPFCL